MTRLLQDEPLRVNSALLADLGPALEKGQLELFYQPIVQTCDSAVVGAEAVIRWRHPRLGLVEPREFVPSAEASGKLAEITAFVVPAACQQLATWAREGVVSSDFRMSVNVCASDLVEPATVSLVARAVETAGVAPSRLIVEITESHAAQDAPAALATVRALRSLGVRVAVDDFGTGYCSLAYLKRFPVDFVKVDKSFVSGLGGDNDDAVLLGGILSLAHALGLTAITEGIETEAQLEALRQLDCQFAQGYLWSPPVPAGEFLSTAASLKGGRLQRSLSCTSLPVTLGRAPGMGWRALDSLPHSVAVLDSTGTIVATNLAWQQKTAVSGASLGACGPGANYLQVCDAAVGSGADEAALAARGIRAVLGGTRPSFSLEYDCSAPGRPGYFILGVRPLANRTGAVVTHYDITDLREVECALSESKQQLALVFECAPIGIVHMDNDAVIRNVNPAFAAIAGRPRDELIGRPASALTTEDGTELLMQALGARGQQSKVPVPLDQVRPDGTTRKTRMAVRKLLDDDGQVTGYLATVEDVTEMLDLEEQLRRASQQEAIGRLAAGIAHEINTPMQFLSDNLAFMTSSWASLELFGQSVKALLRALRVAGGSGVEIAAEGVERAMLDADLGFIEEEMPQALAQSRDGIDRVTKIVTAMKALSHRDTDQPELGDLNKIAKDTVTLARNELKHVADVSFDLADLPPLLCYPNAVGQVLLNLIVNAADAIADVVGGSGAKGTITIRTSFRPGYQEVSVTDTGTGMSPSVARHIFEPFFTTKAPGRGTGQGLALAWSTVVERHHGRVDCSSELGKGSTFTVQLPTGPVLLAQGEGTRGEVEATK